MRSRLTQQAGVAVRKLRLSKGWTLAQLSDRSGVPLSTLSKLELGQSSLTYDKLMRICQALEVDPGLSLLRETTPAPPVSSGRRSVARAGDGQGAMLGPHPARLIAPDLLAKSFSPLVLDLAANVQSPPMQTLSGEVFLYTLEGEAVLLTRVYAPLRLAAGDSIYFDGVMEHALAAGDGAAARVLLVVSGDGIARPEPG